jgi:hypothetical protein
MIRGIFDQCRAVFNGTRAATENCKRFEHGVIYTNCSPMLAYIPAANADALLVLSGDNSLRVWIQPGIQEAE